MAALAQSRFSTVPGGREVWRAGDLRHEEETVLPTGHAALDAQLPGGGWPAGMVEVLQERAGQHVWQLLAPALVRALAQQSGPVVLVAPPCVPFLPSLAARGLPGERVLCVHTDKPAVRLWVAEQALRCAEVAAVLAWVPQARSADLRRLHLAAQQQGRLLFVFRGLEQRHEASPARLRLQVAGTQTLEVRILKRRGPPLEQPVSLPAHPARLAALLAARKARGVRQPILAERSHALDRTVALA